MRPLLLLPVVCSGCWFFGSAGSSSEPDVEAVLSEPCSGPELEPGTTIVRASFGGLDIGPIVAMGTQCGDLDLEQLYKWRAPADGVYEIRVESTVPIVLGFGRKYSNRCLAFDQCEWGERGFGRFGLVPSESPSENGGAGGAGGALEIPDIETVFVATLRTEELGASGYDHYIAVGRLRPADPDETAPYVITIAHRDDEP